MLTLATQDLESERMKTKEAVEKLEGYAKEHDNIIDERFAKFKHYVDSCLKNLNNKELEAKVQAGYSILEGRNPEMKIPVNGTIMTNSDSQAMAIANAINRVNAAKPIAKINTVTPLTWMNIAGPSLLTPVANLNNIVEPNEEDTNRQIESSCLGRKRSRLGQRKLQGTGCLRGGIHTMTLTTPKGNHANKVILNIVKSPHMLIYIYVRRRMSRLGRTPTTPSRCPQPQPAGGKTGGQQRTPEGPR